MSTGWLDCSAGISGDMLLGALVDAGVELAVLQGAVDAVVPGAVRLQRSTVERAGTTACKLDVQVLAPDAPTRTWADVRLLLERAALPVATCDTSLEVFRRLAVAEAAVHGVPVEQVHFHEVGALDAIADVVGGVAAVLSLGLTRLTASTVTLGSGRTRGAHGPLPVPPPAVLALLEGAPVVGGPVEREMTTPTGAALLAVLADGFGPLPPMVLRGSGSGAGGRDPAELANVLRLVLGDPVSDAEPVDACVLLETNVDDLDPRLWPGVLSQLLSAGAQDAWLTPIVMKKGRPAHALSVLCPPPLVKALREVVFRETSTLGLREQRVERTVLEREERVVEVDGQRVRVKLGRSGGAVVNAMPEWDDVAAAAAALGKPAKLVLQQAHAAVLAQIS